MRWRVFDIAEFAENSPHDASQSPRDVPGTGADQRDIARFPEPDPRTTAEFRLSTPFCGYAIGWGAIFPYLSSSFFAPRRIAKLRHQPGESSAHRLTRNCSGVWLTRIGWGGKSKMTHERAKQIISEIPDDQLIDFITTCSNKGVALTAEIELRKRYRSAAATRAIKRDKTETGDK